MIKFITLALIFSGGDLFASCWQVNIVKSNEVERMMVVYQNSDTLELPFSIDSEMPNVLIPKVHFESDSCLIIRRGYGFNFRELIVLWYDSNRIQTSSFITYLLEESRENWYFVFDQKLYQTSFENPFPQKVNYRVEKESYEITEFWVGKSQLQIWYSNGEGKAIELKEYEE